MLEIIVETVADALAAEVGGCNQARPESRFCRKRIDSVGRHGGTDLLPGQH